MANIEDKYALLFENLTDSGCSHLMIEKFMSLYLSSKKEDIMHLLSNQRSILLQIVHENQKKLDCLDFLIYKIEKGEI